MSAKSDYIVLIDAGQACICNQYGSVRNRVGDYGATSANISAVTTGLSSTKSEVVEGSSIRMVV